MADLYANKCFIFNGTGYGRIFMEIKTHICVNYKMQKLFETFCTNRFTLWRKTSLRSQTFGDIFVPILLLATVHITRFRF